MPTAVFELQSPPLQSIPANVDPEKISLVDAEGAMVHKKKGQQRQEGRLWLTVEFFLYYTIIGISTIQVLRAAWEMSSKTSENYSRYKRLLQDGWFGTKIDLSDDQYRSFRDNAGMLGLGLAAYVLLGRFVLDRVPMGRFMGAMAFLTILHGANAVKPLALAMSFYAIHRLPRAGVFAWALGIASLFATEWCSLPLPFDSLWTGLYRRWNVIYKVSLLRMISFCMDYSWRSQHDPLNHHMARCKKCKESADGSVCVKAESMIVHSEERFTWHDYLEYVFYPPLYIAGPIMTFNSFRAQIKRRSTSFSGLTIYAARWLGCFLLLDGLLSTFYVCAIKEHKAYDGFTPLQTFALAFFCLKVIWLKLLVIWRFFRTVALADGIVPPENMLRCMTNNYSILGFWRQWHHSFNLWVTR